MGKQREKSRYTESEITRIKSTFKGKRYEKLYLFMMYTGIIPYEIERLSWKDYERELKRVTVRDAVTGKTRRVELRDEALEILDSFPPGLPDERIFPPPFVFKNIYCYFDYSDCDIRRESGIDKFTVRALGRIKEEDKNE